MQGGPGGGDRNNTSRGRFAPFEPEPAKAADVLRESIGRRFPEGALKWRKLSMP
jgi:hypothetical protein